MNESREKAATFVQLIPMAATSEFVDSEPVLPWESPSVAVQAERDPEESSEQVLPEWNPVISVGAVPPITPRLDSARSIVRASGGRPPLNETVAPIAWPQISNPQRMTAYIRGRYNAIFAVHGFTGTVVLSLWVDERGVVERVRLIESSGTDILDEIALRTFGEVVTFSPARDGPRALAVQFNLAVPFLTAW